MGALMIFTIYILDKMVLVIIQLQTASTVYKIDCKHFVSIRIVGILLNRWRWMLMRKKILNAYHMPTFLRKQQEKCSPQMTLGNCIVCTWIILEWQSCICSLTLHALFLPCPKKRKKVCHAIDNELCIIAYLYHPTWMHAHTYLFCMLKNFLCSRILSVFQGLLTIKLSLPCF